MLKSEIKNLAGNLWGAVAAVEGCVTKSAGGSTSVFLDKSRIIVHGPYGYGEAMFPEELPLERPVSVPGNELMQLLNAVPEGEVALQMSDSGLVIRSGRFRGTLAAHQLEEEDMPDVPELGEEKAVLDMDEASWLVLNRASDFADSASSNMAELTSLYWGPEGLMACNRISLIHYPRMIMENEMLVPKFSIAGANKMGMAPQRAAFGSYHIQWAWPDCQIITPSAVSDYPVQRLLDIMDSAEKGESRWSCEHSDLFDAVNRISMLHDQMSISIQRKRMILKSLGTIPSNEIIIGELYGEDLSDRSFIFSVAEAKRLLTLSDTINWKLGGGDSKNLLLVKTDDFAGCSALTVDSNE
jgi:hypothetical protein